MIWFGDPMKTNEKLSSIHDEIKKLYIDENKSCPEIRDIIEKEYGCSCARQTISQYVKKSFGTRSQAQGMKTRAITGRMNYKKVSEKIDYVNRKIDYKEIWLKRSPDYNGPLKNPKTKQVSLPQPYVERIRQYAKQNKKTISDTLKEILSPFGWQHYKKYILTEIQSSFRPYTYDKRQLMEFLDNRLPEMVYQSKWKLKLEEGLKNEKSAE